MVSSDSRYQRSDNIVFRRIENESLLVPIKSNVGDMGSIYNLNEVGAFIWDLLDGSHRLADIREKMTQEYEVSQEQAEEDLLEFVSQLEQIAAIRPVG